METLNKIDTYGNRKVLGNPTRTHKFRRSGGSCRTVHCFFGPGYVSIYRWKEYLQEARVVHMSLFEEKFNRFMKVT